MQAVSGSPNAKQHSTPPPPAGPLFRKYLRAFHDYDPTRSKVVASVGGTAVTSALKSGDVILVHLTNANGWADGTILRTGIRGWLPTNYCEVYDHGFIRNLLHGLTQLWDSITTTANRHQWNEGRQDHLQALIAGVRYLLERADCLHREDEMVKANLGIRRTRKSLLTDLANLIKQQETLGQRTSDDIQADKMTPEIEEYLSTVFRMVTRAVRFLDIWIQSTSAKENGAPGLSGLIRDASWTTGPTQNSPSLPQVPPVDGQKDSEGPTSDTKRNSVDDRAVLPSQRLARKASDRTSQAVHIAQLAVRQPMAALATMSESRRRISMALIARIHPAEAPQPELTNLASERLSAAHDDFIESMGFVIGLHMSSRSSLDIAALTTGSLNAYLELLAILTLISTQARARSSSLNRAIAAMRTESSKLKAMAQKLRSLSENEDEGSVILNPEDGSSLVALATACVRGAGDCVDRARRLIDEVGDVTLRLEDIALLDGRRFSSIAGIGAILGPTPPESGDERDCEFKIAPVELPGSGGHLYLAELPASPAIFQPAELPASLPSPKGFSVQDDSDNELVELGPVELQAAPVSPAVKINGTVWEPLATIEASPGDSASPRVQIVQWVTPVRNETKGIFTTASTSTKRTSFRNSTGTAASNPSTRATTPDKSEHAVLPELEAIPAALASFASLTSMRSAVTDGSDKEAAPPALASFGSLNSMRSNVTDGSEKEAAILAKTYAHELLYNKDGHMMGGSLKALVELLTSRHSAPNAATMTAFYLTFRLFTNAVELTQALIQRYEYAGDGTVGDAPARLRVFNFFKQWLEHHWIIKTDAPALPAIREFAIGRVALDYPTAGRRLEQLVVKVDAKNAKDEDPVPGSQPGMSFSKTFMTEMNAPPPPSIISKSQLSMLQKAKAGVGSCSFTDFEPLEIARQFTLIESILFCSIKPEELLASEWTKKKGKAYHVRSLSRFATDLANLVADTVLYKDSTKKRANIIKQWIQIGKACLDLKNYDSLMAIMCSLSSSTIVRLKRTWALIPERMHKELDEMKAIIDITRNHAVLRQRLQDTELPCLPFVGIYLTDLTFVDAGNQNTRQLPSSMDSVEPVTVINFDKHMRTAKIISTMQRFQVPYSLRAVPEMRAWIKSEVARTRSYEEKSGQTFYERSLEIEPRVEMYPQTKAGSGHTIPFFGHKKISRPETANSVRSAVAKGRFGFGQYKSMTDLRLST